MTIALTYDEVKVLTPCSDNFELVISKLGGKKKWNKSGVDAAAAVKAGVSFDDLVLVTSIISRTNPDVKRRLRLWIADCAARVIHIYEKTGNSDTPRKAIVAARQFARGEIDDAASDVARAAAWAAAGAAAWAAARAAAWAAARAAASDVARAAAWAGARAAAGAAAWAAASDAEEEWQLTRLVEWLSDNEPEDWPLPNVSSQQISPKRSTRK